MVDNKKISIEDLAVMIQRGFEDISTKKEVNDKFEQVDRRFDENDGKFTRLLAFVATQDDIKDIKSEMVELRKTVESLTRAVDRLAKVVDNLRIEYASLMNQVNRHEKWFQLIADKVGVKLEY